MKNDKKEQSTRMYTEQQVIELMEKMKEVEAKRAGYAPSQQSILSIDPKQFINELKTKIRCKE